MSTLLVVVSVIYALPRTAGSAPRLNDVPQESSRLENAQEISKPTERLLVLGVCEAAALGVSGVASVAPAAVGATGLFAVALSPPRSKNLSGNIVITTLAVGMCAYNLYADDRDRVPRRHVFRDNMIFAQFMILAEFLWPPSGPEEGGEACLIHPLVQRGVIGLVLTRRFGGTRSLV